MKISTGLLDGTSSATRGFILVACCTLVSLTMFGQSTPADTNNEQKLRELDAAWSAAAAAKDVDKTVSYYADDAVVFAPNAPAATTKEAIRNIWKEMISPPSTSGGWKTAKVVVSNSGDLASVNGTYEFTMNDSSGKPVSDHGNYVAVFKKQTDGSWKCVVDMWNSDMPAPKPTS